MDDYIYSFLDYIRVERNYSDYTDTNYELDLNNYESYLKSKRKSYLNIKYKDVMEYISYLKEECNLESTSINRHLSSIRSFVIASRLSPFTIIRSFLARIMLPIPIVNA